MSNSIFPTALFKALVLVSFLAASSLCNSANIPLDKLLTDIRDKSAAIHSISCDFTQKRNLALFQKPIVFHGKLAIIRPDKLRWEFISPIPSILIFNGKSGLRCDKNSAPVTFDLVNDPIMQMVAEQLWTWLDGDYSKLQNEYSIELNGDSAIIVTPDNKQTAEIIESISIFFHQENRQPESVNIIEPGGDSTFISFSGYQLSPELPDSTFTQCFPSD